jgi:hypothetical protein
MTFSVPWAILPWRSVYQQEEALCVKWLAPLLVITGEAGNNDFYTMHRTLILLPVSENLVYAKEYKDENPRQAVALEIHNSSIPYI